MQTSMMMADGLHLLLNLPGLGCAVDDAPGQSEGAEQVYYIIIILYYIAVCFVCNLHDTLTIIMCYYHSSVKVEDKVMSGRCAFTMLSNTDWSGGLGGHSTDCYMNLQSICQAIQIIVEA